MKIYTGGARFYADQISRIDQGFVALGHELVPIPHDADLIYVNNPPFTDLASEKANFRGKLIFDVQDIPHHIRDFDTHTLAAQLREADAVTSISQTTANDLKVATGIESTVVYQPIMPVTREPRNSGRRRFLFAGRVNDPNKFSHLAANALITLGFGPSDVITVGSEAPWFGGDYAGPVSNERLNELYNSVDFVCCCARYEGICLPLIEAMAAGAIPLLFNDLSTRSEFLGNAFPEYDQVDRTSNRLAAFIAQFLQDDDRMVQFKERLHQHYLDQWAHHFTGQAVAAKILEVYHSL